MHDHSTIKCRKPTENAPSTEVASNGGAVESTSDVTLEQRRSTHPHQVSIQQNQYCMCDRGAGHAILACCFACGTSLVAKPQNHALGERQRQTALHLSGGRALCGGQVTIWVSKSMFDVQILIVISLAIAMVISEERVLSSAKVDANLERALVFQIPRSPTSRPYSERKSSADDAGMAGRGLEAGASGECKWYMAEHHFRAMIGCTSKKSQRRRPRADY